MTEHRMHVPALGRRGEGWVVIQAILLVIVAVTGLIGARWPQNLQAPALLTAIVSGVAGLWLGWSGVRTLGGSLSPLPKPPGRSELTDSGVYALVRHPIYGGILLLAFAWSLALSPWALVPVGALGVALVLKSRLEERWLTDRHPSYPGYRDRVRRRFVPYLW
ncbi:MAG TPA: isoprenylcysteine carboxylmethyltransferase family protein [Jiangellaceae bacterium]|nr:isoprenylcysteine carboxylmethyltransferase family protein [Jiangellaceae bacterium]